MNINETYGEKWHSVFSLFMNSIITVGSSSLIKSNSDNSNDVLNSIKNNLYVY